MSKAGLKIGLPRGAAVMLLFAALIGCTLFISSCSNEEDTSATNTRTDMVDYYSNKSVESYHKDISDALNATVAAYDSGDEETLKTAVNNLNDKCEILLAVNIDDVPESMQPYHERMLDVAKAEERFAAAIYLDDYETAILELNTALVELEEAKKLLPSATG